MSQKANPSDAFDEIHQVVLYGMSDNMASLVESEKYGAINTTETTTNGFYVIMFRSEVYTLQYLKKIDGKVITAGELVVKAHTLIGIVINIPNIISSQCQHAQ